LNRKQLKKLLEVLKMESIKKQLMELFEQDEQLFNAAIEELDSYNGYLNDNRYYSMDELNEFYNGTEPLELLQRVYFGYDADTWTTDSSGNKTHSEFNPNREYFKYNGYGNLVSSDYRDYSHLLDDDFIEDLIENAEHLYLDDEIMNIINGAAEEVKQC
jgi:hypothetical protein